MQIFSLDTLPVSRWKNGGGETREICRIPSDEPDGDFAWRASIATIERDGDFSCFPGVDRVITLLSGDGVDLCGEGWRHRLTLHQPFAFAASWRSRRSYAAALVWTSISWSIAVVIGQR